MDENTVVCPQCGILQCSKQEFLRKNLAPYPEIQKAYENVICTFGKNDFDARAEAMYDNVAVMGIGLIAGGKKIAYLILKLRFDIFK